MAGRPSLGPRRQVNVRLPDELVQQIDSSRGVLSRDKWMERAARLALRPTALVLDPDLRQTTHTHAPARPSRTDFKNGQRERYYYCECGAEFKP